MFKTGRVLLIVDSVQAASKFYTEKLGFDIAEIDIQMDPEKHEKVVKYVSLFKGKFFIAFRMPYVEELADFSFIKRCSNRCTGVCVKMKKGLDRFYAKCKKRGLNIVHELKNQSWGERSFSIRDPFGILLTFSEPIPNFKPDSENFVGLKINKSLDKKALVEEMSKYLKEFGILRRPAKKFSKLWIKKSLK